MERNEIKEANRKAMPGFLLLALVGALVGGIVKSTTTYMTAYKNCYIIIKNVPCQKCSQCGEEFINGSTMQKIESIISKLKSMLPEITVIDFQNAA